MNFDNVFPYNQIKEVVIDGQAMIWYPKTYVRALDLPGGEYKGKYAWQISQYPEEGFHVHRAFIDFNGKERDGFYLGKYEASNQNGVPGSIVDATPWVSISQANAIVACQKRNADTKDEAKSDWHLETCFEYWFISLLILIELGNADVQSAIGRGQVSGSAVKCGSTNAVWRGLHEHWGNATEIVDGYKTDGNNIVQFWDTSGEHYVSTGKKIEDKGIARGAGSGYDFSDAFIPADDKTGSTFLSTTSDGAYAGTGNNIALLGGSCGGGRGSGNGAGLFTFFGVWTNTENDAESGFRLAKY